MIVEYKTKDYFRILLAGETEGFHGREIKPQVFLIGEATYNSQHKRWQALANVCGTLAIIEIKMEPLGENDNA